MAREFSRMDLPSSRRELLPCQVMYPSGQQVHWRNLQFGTIRLLIVRAYMWNFPSNLVRTRISLIDIRKFIVPNQSRS